MSMLEPVLEKNDRRAYLLIGTFSFIVFAVVSVLSRYHLAPKLNFDVHIFARVNAVINSVVSVLLVIGFYFVKQRKYILHRNVMLVAMILSILFLVSYIAHHLLAPDTIFPKTNPYKYVYYIILATHILLAAVIMPIVLFSAYRSLSGDYARHKKIARIAWPIWLYVSITGVIVYLMISPYYGAINVI